MKQEYARGHCIHFDVRKACQRRSPGQVASSTKPAHEASDGALERSENVAHGCDFGGLG